MRPFGEVQNKATRAYTSGQYQKKRKSTEVLDDESPTSANLGNEAFGEVQSKVMNTIMESHVLFIYLCFLGVTREI